MRKFLNRLAINAMCGAFTAKEKVCQAVEDLKRDERGLSGIVVAVLLILVAVLAIVMLWGSLSEWLGELWDKITGSGNTISGGSSFG